MKGLNCPHIVTHTCKLKLADLALKIYYFSDFSLNLISESLFPVITKKFNIKYHSNVTAFVIF